MAKETQPINNIVWISRDELSANLYNPNAVAKPEMRLLKQSIMEDGWLFPILVFDKSVHVEGMTNNENNDVYTIVDGFHRYTISGDKDVYDLTNGFVPCIIIQPKNPMATTVRMNRAKGNHGVLKMSEIVLNQVESGVDVDVIMKNFGMEREEVMRLSRRGGIALSDRVRNAEWSKAWVPDKRHR